MKGLRWGLAFVLLGMTVVVEASVTATTGTDPQYGSAYLLVTVDGEITPASADELAAELAHHDPSLYSIRWVYLNSPGGDVRSAMRMGRDIRKHRLDTMIPPGMRCLSSCIYLLAAGDSKTVAGQVGIHRPYFVTSPGEPADVAEQLKQLIAASKAYFVDMNIPEGLVEEMFSTPPSSMKILSPAELQSYRLSQRDIVQDEVTGLEMAQSLGVSRTTIVRFYADINAQCARFTGEVMKRCMCDVSQNYEESIQEVACLSLDRH